MGSTDVDFLGLVCSCGVSSVRLGWAEGGRGCCKSLQRAPLSDVVPVMWCACVERPASEPLRPVTDIRVKTEVQELEGHAVWALSIIFFVWPLFPCTHD